MSDWDLITEFGRRKKGKSTLALHIAYSVSRRIVVFDPANQFCDGFTIDGSERDFDPLFEAGFCPLVFAAGDRDPDLAFQECGEMCFENGNLTLIVDEASFLQSPDRINPMLSRMARVGRHSGIRVITTQHRPQDSHGLIPSIADRMLIFRLTHERDLKKVAEFTAPAVAEMVARLEEFQYVDWNAESETFYANLDSASWKISIADMGRIEEREASVDGR